MENGQRLSAVELQRQYLECAKQYFEQAESDPITEQVMEKWEYVLKHLESEPSSLDRELDWVIKEKLIKAYVARQNLKWDSPKVSRLDLEYHNIRKEGEKPRGFYYKLEKKDEVERIVTDEQVDNAMHHPPETTRAKFRGRFVKLANERKILCGVNWSYIQLYEPYQKLFLSTDPLKSEYEEASRMIYSI